LRPRAYEEDDNDEAANNSTRSQTDNNMNETTNAPVKSFFPPNLTEYFNCSLGVYHLEANLINGSVLENNSTLPMEDSDEWTPISECPLLDISTLSARV
jgi:hypothetical protein